MSEVIKHTVAIQYSPDGDVFFFCDICGAEWKINEKGKLRKFVAGNNPTAVHDGFSTNPGFDNGTMNATMKG